MCRRSNSYFPKPNAHQSASPTVPMRWAFFFHQPKPKRAIWFTRIMLDVAFMPMYDKKLNTRLGLGFGSSPRVPPSVPHVAIEWNTTWGPHLHAFPSTTGALKILSRPPKKEKEKGNDSTLLTSNCLSDQVTIDATLTKCNSIFCTILHPTSLE